MNNCKSINEQLKFTPRIKKAYEDVLPRLRNNREREGTITSPASDEGKNPFLDVFMENPDTPYVINLANAIVRSLKIKSNYIFKELLSYTDYNTVLKLVKYNTKIQNLLDFSIDNYKKKISFKYKKIIDKKPYNCYHHEYNEFFSAFLFFYFPIIYCINYNKASLYTILIANIFSFFYIFYNIISFFLILALIEYQELKSTFKDFDKRFIAIIKKLDKNKKLILSLIFIIYSIYECLGILKLYLFYYIKKEKFYKLIIFEYIFISLTFLFIFILCCSIYIFFIDIHIYFVLVQFNDIPINRFKLPSDFDKMKKLERKKFILRNIQNYRYKLDNNIIYVVDNVINGIRKIYDLPNLIINKYIKLPNFIINEPFDLIFNPEKEVFQLSNNEFLIKYKNKKGKNGFYIGGIQVSQFENFIKNNQAIINIIINTELDNILVITQENIFYFLIYKSHCNKYEEKFIFDEPFIFDYKNEYRLYFIEEKNDIKKITKEEYPCQNVLIN